MVAGLAVTAQSATYTWTGSGADAAWSTTANWTPSPTLSGADLIFTSSGTQRSNYIASTLSIKGVAFDSGAPDTYIRLSSLGTGSGVRNLGLNVSGSYINVNSGANGNYTIDGPGAFLINQSVSINHNGNGTLTLGKLAASTANNYGITKTGTGTLILSGANTFTGAIAVANGTLLVNGNSSAATGAVTVSFGAALGGSGTVGGVTTVAGDLKPGSSPGALTFTRGLTLADTSATTFEIASLSSFDVLANDGGDTITFQDGADVLFDFAGYTAVYNDSFLVLSNWGSRVASGTLNLSVTNLTAGYSLDTSNLLTTGVVTVIPEPATIGMLGLGALITLVLRRRLVV